MCVSWQNRSQKFVLGGALLRPVGPKFEAEGLERGGFFWVGGSEPLPIS